MTERSPVVPASDVVRRQAEAHPLVREADIRTLQQVVLHLMHGRAYEEAARYVAGRSVLDLGCNTGYGTLRIAPGARHVVGVDVSAAALEEARSRPGADAVEFRLVDGRHLPFADASFDVIVSFQVIEHIEEPVPFLSELRRVLRPGGVALLTTPNAAFRLDPGMKPWNPFHVREYRPAELERLLRRVFDDVTVKGMFATPELYEVERARVQRSLRHARHLAHVARSEGGGQASQGGIRGRWHALVQPLRRVVDRARAAAGRVRRAPEPASAPRPLGDAAAEQPDADLGRFSTADLEYREENIDEAMDLLAICVR